ncbi:MAG: tetratricopeptide repeat protein [Anaerolineae bacterium]
MPWNSGLKKLHKLLAELYRTEDRARMAVTFAGLDTSQITFHSAAQPNWFNILEEAEGLGMVDALIRQACDDYPNRCDELSQAYGEYLGQLRTDSSQQASTSGLPAPLLGKSIQKKVNERISDQETIWGQLQRWLGLFFQILGVPDAALKRYERALELAEQVGDVRLQGETLRAMGTVYRAQGDYPGARVAFERALAIFEQFLPPDHPNLRAVHGDLESLIKIPDGD